MASADLRHGDVLSHGHLFGLKTDVKSNVHFVDEHLVVYPCGHSVVFLHVESRAQQVRYSNAVCTQKMSSVLHARHLVQQNVLRMNQFFVVLGVFRW